METLVFLGWTALAVPALVASGLLAWQTWEHRRFVRSRLAAAPRSGPLGPVALLVPCKGLDHDLADNLRALLSQDYAPYHVLFLIEDASDPAATTVQRLLLQGPPGRGRLVLTGRATASGQKVHNLLRGLDALEADDTLRQRVEILAFADSDARPRPDWLRRLVDRLNRGASAASTGYRWFVPRRRTLANLCLTAINGAAASLARPRGNTLLWGGAWAMTRSAAERLDLRGLWAGQLNDDLAVSRAAAAAGVDVSYEPGCVVPSSIDHSWASLAEFARRQYIQARLYRRGWWRAAVAHQLLAQLAFWGGTAVTALGAARSAGWWPAAAGLLGGLYAAGLVRATVRRSIGRLYLPEHRRDVEAAWWVDALLHPVVGLVNAALLVASAFPDRLVWRGIRYQFDAEGRVRSLEHPPAAEPADAANRPAVPSGAASPPHARRTSTRTSTSPSKAD